jgi:CRP/FNR family transcriptional regulator
MNDELKRKIQQFFSQYKSQSYAKNEILIRADDNPLGIYYLKSGQVKMYGISKKGEETIITIFKPSSFFPMSWAINDTQNRYYYEALTNSSVWRAPKDRVLEFLSKHSDVLLDLVSRMYEGLEGMTERLVYSMGGSAYERLIIELIITVKRFGKKALIFPKAHEISVSETHLAAQTGLTRETISRELKELKGKKLVTFEKNKLIILDLDLLEKELMDTD